MAAQLCNGFVWSRTHTHRPKRQENQCTGGVYIMWLCYATCIGAHKFASTFKSQGLQRSVVCVCVCSCSV